MEIIEKTLTEEYIYKGKIINLRKDTVMLPNGKTAAREVVEHNGGVCVLPVDNDGNVYFVTQFRYPYKEKLLEVPAGKRDSKDEDVLLCGKRELKEEIGAVAKKFTFLGELYPSPGYVGEIIYMYLAKDLEFGENDLDEDEFLNVEKMPFTTALEMALDGRIKDAKTLVCLLKYGEFLKEKKSNERV